MRPSPGIPLGANTPEIEMAKEQKHVIEVLVYYRESPSQNNGACLVAVDGVFPLRVLSSGASQSSVVALPNGFTVHAGSSVGLLNGLLSPDPIYRAWGYLANE